MMGLLVLAAMGLYLLFSVVAVLLAIRFAKKHGKSNKRWGWGAVLVMYLIPFWDWLPTVAVHQYYCATESGFWVYKTLGQWKEENPGEVEKLISYNKNPSGHGYAILWPSQYELYSSGHKKITTYQMNRRFNRVTEKQDILEILPVMRTEETLIDIEKNEVIARYIGFSTGHSVAGRYDPSNPWKAWLRSSSCRDGKKHDAESWKFSLQFKGTENSMDKKLTYDLDMPFQED
ncbi:MAG: hypothetical protein FWH15_02945 [Betaproteobacteria bacterium]|nr:hypothetical protein [Betaproteobacteria bacterium]